MVAPDNQYQGYALSPLRIQRLNWRQYNCISTDETREYPYESSS